MEYIIEINTGNSDLDKTITRLFATGARLKEIVKYAVHKGYSKHDTVDGFKQCCRRYGYSGSPAKIPLKKPLASDWQEAGDGIQYSESLGLYWDGRRSYDKLSARHNGIT